MDSFPLPKDHPDIVKIGYMKKMKTMKPKLFVLHDRSATGPVRLEYHDSEKKFRRGIVKRSIPLGNCFSINPKTDARHKYAIALYTKDDCFAMACDSEEHQQDWLSVLLEFRAKATDAGGSKQIFEHIWPVTVRPKGLGNGRCISQGPYRLCLTNDSFSLVRLNQEDPDLVVQLGSIRRCGHTECFFFMELGRSARTGPGEVWMQVEDTMIAKSMHDVILIAMKSFSLATSGGQPSFRNRSRSQVEKTSKPVKVPQKQSSVGHDSSTLPMRSKTFSMADQPRSPLKRRHSHSPNKAMGAATGTLSAAPSIGLSLPHSPLSSCPLSLLTGEAHRARTDSMESRGSRGTTSSVSADEGDLYTDQQTSVARSVTPDCSILEEDPYFDMTPVSTPGSAPGSNRELLFDMHVTTPEIIFELDDAAPLLGTSPQMPYISISAPIENPISRASLHQTDSSYMEMSSNSVTRSEPSDTSPYMDMTAGGSSSSSVVSSTASSHEVDDSSYLDMMPQQSHSLPKFKQFGHLDIDSYLDMSSRSHSPHSTSNTPSGSSSSSLRPDKVYSYLMEDGTQPFQPRAYSVGSKPSPRAKPLHESYLDMSGVPAIQKTNLKTCSAPHLMDKDPLAAAVNKSRGFDSSCSQSSIGSSSIDPETDERLMQMEFAMQTESNFHPRTYSGGSSDFRHRASSGGTKDLKKRATSFGPSDRERSSSFGAKEMTHRHRTSTLGSDFLRNSSGIGASDMRPRSSSYGNARFRELRKSIKEGKKTTSTDSLRRSHIGKTSTPEPSKSETAQKASGFSLPPRTVNDDGYMDISFNSVSSSPSVSSSGKDFKSGGPTLSTIQADDSYFTMVPQISNSNTVLNPPPSNYMAMTAGQAVSSSAPDAGYMAVTIPDLPPDPQDDAYFDMKPSSSGTSRGSRGSQSPVTLRSASQANQPTLQRAASQTNQPTVQRAASMAASQTNQPTVQRSASMAASKTNQPTVQRSASVAASQTNQPTVQCSASMAASQTNQPTVQRAASMAAKHQTKKQTTAVSRAVSQSSLSHRPLSQTTSPHSSYQGYQAPVVSPLTLPQSSSTSILRKPEHEYMEIEPQPAKHSGRECESASSKRTSSHEGKYGRRRSLKESAKGKQRDVMSTTPLVIHERGRVDSQPDEYVHMSSPPANVVQPLSNLRLDVLVKEPLVITGAAQNSSHSTFHESITCRTSPQPGLDSNEAGSYIELDLGNQCTLSPDQSISSPVNSITASSASVRNTDKCDDSSYVQYSPAPHVTGQVHTPSLDKVTSPIRAAPQPSQSLFTPFPELGPVRSAQLPQSNTSSSTPPPLPPAHVNTSHTQCVNKNSKKHEYVNVDNVQPSKKAKSQTGSPKPASCKLTSTNRAGSCPTNESSQTVSSIITPSPPRGTCLPTKQSSKPEEESDYMEVSVSDTGSPTKISGKERRSSTGSYNKQGDSLTPKPTCNIPDLSALGVSNVVKLPSRGSTGCLINMAATPGSSLPSGTTGAMPTRGSASSLSSMDRNIPQVLVSRHVATDPFGLNCPMECAAEQESLNYVTVDLSSSDSDLSVKTPTRCRHVSGEEDPESQQYAQIDFAKSEDLKRKTSKH